MNAVEFRKVALSFRTRLLFEKGYDLGGESFFVKSKSIWTAPCGPMAYRTAKPVNPLQAVRFPLGLSAPEDPSRTDSGPEMTDASIAISPRTNMTEAPK